MNPPFTVGADEDVDGPVEMSPVRDAGGESLAMCWVRDDALELIRRLNTGAALEAAVRETIKNCEKCREVTDVPGPCVECAKFAQILDLHEGRR